MDALEFAKQRRRMCRSVSYCCSICRRRGKHCILGTKNSTLEDDTELINDVEQWAKEHPERTRQSEFLKMFPDAMLDKDGYILARPCSFEKSYSLIRRRVCYAFTNCDNCRRKYWLTPIED